MITEMNNWMARRRRLSKEVIKGCMNTLSGLEAIDYLRRSQESVPHIWCHWKPMVIFFLSSQQVCGDSCTRQGTNVVIDLITLKASDCFTGFPIVILMPLLRESLFSLRLDSWSSAWCLVVDLCICFHQLLDEGSMITGYSPI
ncbi:uncharacterized protein LOC121832172 [Peromyscus maniculatus bairdii]|uniref:uncharacterized protein LOC121832172 n=1 Tax=Peromyscus maniculatus bairdii TaxID=230844 RepID=UPI003FCFC834